MELFVRNIPPAPEQGLRGYFATLLRHFGPQGWWPARTRLEVILGAILTQNTSWRNAARAVAGLRNAGLLNLPKLSRASRAEIEACIRPAGFYRQKAATIRNLLAWLSASSAGSLRKLFARPAEELRQSLLAIKGFGPETVDAILLYAGNKPFFVADAYTRRVLARHGMVAKSADYATVQQFLHGHLPRDPALYSEFHALLVEAGKRYCKRRAPDCLGCPLQPFLAPRIRVQGIVSTQWQEIEPRSGTRSSTLYKAAPPTRTV